MSLIRIVAPHLVPNRGSRRAGRPMTGWPRHVACICLRCSQSRLVVKSIEMSSPPGEPTRYGASMNRTALVTGASSGIGRSTAAALVARGYRVLGTCRTPSRLTDRLEGVEYLALDLADERSIESLSDRLTGLDVLVNNAGESHSG